MPDSKPTIKITVTPPGGAPEEYWLDTNRISGRIVSEMRAATGWSWRGAITALGADADLDVIAACIWLSLRIAAGANSVIGKTWDQLLDELTYDHDFAVEWDAKQEVDAGESNAGS